MAVDSDVFTLQYNVLISVLERLIQHPYSYRINDFIERFRKPMLIQTGVFDIPKVSLVQMLFNLSTVALKWNWYYIKLYLPECNACCSHPPPTVYLKKDTALYICIYSVVSCTFLNL
jgi:hypothetical protein